MKSVSAEQISPGDLQGAPTVKVSMAAIDLLSPCDETNINRMEREARLVKVQDLEALEARERARLARWIPPRVPQVFTAYLK